MRGIIGFRTIERLLFQVAVSSVLIWCVLPACGVAGTGPLPSSGEVVAVFDGDTVMLAGGQKVRYLGIDAPEVSHHHEPGSCFGNEARKANADMVLHKRVSLGYDWESVDSYGRLLAYVVLPDGRCANAELIKSGYAYVFKASKPHARLGEFINLQREAVRKRRGLWGSCAVRPSPFYVGNRRALVLHRAECSMGKRISRRNRVEFKTRLTGLEDGYRPARCCKP